MQRDLFDPDPDVSHGRRTATSAAAHEGIRQHKPGLRAQVLSIIRMRGPRGATLDELCQVLGKPPNSLSGRLTELAARGQIADSGKRRPTRAGHQAIVWVVSEA